MSVYIKLYVRRVLVNVTEQRAYVKQMESSTNINLHGVDRISCLTYINVFYTNWFVRVLGWSTQLNNNGLIIIQITEKI